MELKELLGEELATKASSSTDETLKLVVAKLTTTKLMLGDPTTLIPKSEFNEKIELVKSLKAQIAKHEEDLKTLKTEAETVPTLKGKITEIQEANKAERQKFEADQLKMKKETALLVALMDNGVGDPQARQTLAKTFDVEKLELDESGKPKGIETLLKPMKENPSFKSMFGTPRMVGQEHNRGQESGEFFTREEILSHEGDMAWMTANLKKVNESLAHMK